MEEDAAVACLGVIVVVVGGFGLAKIKLFGWLWVETGRDHDAQTTKLTARARHSSTIATPHLCSWLVIILLRQLPCDAILRVDSCNYWCAIYAPVMNSHVHTLFAYVYKNSCSRG